MRPEYHFDYRKARANRFAERNKVKRLVVVLEPDIAQVFTTPESVNNALRALITAMPPARRSKAAAK
jgi:capsule polysaccharide export protein KpsE/RkpR